MKCGPHREGVPARDFLAIHSDEAPARDDALAMRDSAIVCGECVSDGDGMNDCVWLIDCVIE
eukprot:8614645-Pyramimonas_sp.AAC.1